MTRRQTHTFAELELSQPAYDEIRAKLEEAGYQHAFLDGGAIDMHGIGVTRSADEAGEPPIRWGEDPEVTVDMLLLTGLALKPDANELLAIVRVWTREQCELAERWAGAVHVHASDNADVDVPELPAHVAALQQRGAS